MQRYLGWGSDAAELSLEDQTAAVCQSEHPVGADLHSQDEQMDNLRQFQFHLLLAPHYYKIISHELKKYNLPLWNLIYLHWWWSVYQANFNLQQQKLTFLIPQFTSEPWPCLVGLSRTTPSRYSDSSSVLMWWGLSNGFSNPFRESLKKKTKKTTN